MAKNANLNRAKREKNDEFYTMFVDIEKELQHYSKHFQNKTVYCNCDDPSWSNFWLYFHLNYDRLGLKGLISTHFTKDASSYKAEYHGESDWNGLEWVETPLSGNGDFRSEDCVEVLKAADIVVTNPPFSLFREFVAGLVKHQKQFLVIGHQGAITYKEVFPLIKENKVWYGASIHSGDRKFNVPNSYPLIASGCGVDEDGKRFIRVKGVRWFTNLDVSYRHDGLWHKNGKFDNAKAHCYYEGFEDNYPKYDNYDAIEVSKTKDIPIDYPGVMGVPITFMDKYDPDKFEILGCSYSFGDIGEPWHKSGSGFKVSVDGKSIYNRLFIRNRLLNPSET